MAFNCPEPRDLRQVGLGENKNAWGISKYSNVMQILKNHDRYNLGSVLSRWQGELMATTVLFLI